MAADPSSLPQQVEPALEASPQRAAPIAPASQAAQLQYVYQAIDAQLRDREPRANWYRVSSFVTQLAIALLAASITVITGFQVAGGTGLGAVATNVVLVLSALATLVTLVKTFYAPRELWIALRTYCSDLRDLKEKLEFAERSPDFETRREQVAGDGFAEYQRLTEAYEQTWKAIRERDK
ncbi:DUF4231 domain-containing protein [Variovorax sp. Sphag1AA]|uniref:DUF4231 domain-containing protein n=1 Tax=Variovorax sp. Sphag1AA TaxID=2587027 RepID=UPI00161E012C|nr:SLATT domain-containing protein [Variovorax sp. Sphag1AA]MBB3181310.1 ABC-type transport system involved in cytochrome bd biosynthesis fused ATPase/permease subunit [Variovorax sp. Sphag1AA]